MEKKVRDVTCVNDLTPDYIEWVTEKAIKLFSILREGDVRIFSNYLAGQKCVKLFEQASTRTKDSFTDVFNLLGAASVVGIDRPEESSLAKGESLFHTIDTYIGQGVGTRFIVIRSSKEGSAKWAKISAFRSFAKKVREYAKINHSFPRNLILPIIISGGDSMHSHPSQGLTDYATMKFYGIDKKVKLGICNDIGGSRVASTHIDMAGKLGWEMYFSPFPGAELNARQLFSLLRNGVNSRSFKDTKTMLDYINVLYVNRFQFNQRGLTTGAHASTLFSLNHPQITKDLIAEKKIPLMHARPIDKNAKEISADLYDHPLDISGVQSDFGNPTRMAMCIYAIENDLYSLESIIKTLDPIEMGFFRDQLDFQEEKTIEMERYTTSYFKNGFVIDHIPCGCGTVMSSIIAKMHPDIQIVNSLNVKGEKSFSEPKDVIKLHVSSDFAWTPELNALIALFTEYTARKSCRVSQFVDGRRTGKWAFRSDGGKDKCLNENCISNPKFNEDIPLNFIKCSCKHDLIEVCPFCEWPQHPLLS